MFLIDRNNIKPFVSNYFQIELVVFNMKIFKVFPINVSPPPGGNISSRDQINFSNLA